MEEFDPRAIEKKWQERWEKEGLYRAAGDSSKDKLYVLDMFPYPSGVGLHVGHTRIYTASDVLARYFRMKGFNVLHPMGWDAFGLPAENDAIKKQINPNKLVPKNIVNFKRQMQSLGFSYDWSREFSTADPSYYKWTQWLFLQLFKMGLLYQKKVPINWCEHCQTGLANEEVLAGGIHERCGKPVVKREIKQWLFRITKYADRLLNDLEGLNWPKSIVEMQRNWIGRSEGAEIEFSLDPTLRVGEETLRVEKIKVFTTRPDTIFGVTALVLAPEHPVVAALLTSDAVRRYVEQSKRKSEIERTELTKEKTGVNTGLFATNPINGEKIPIWVADYVIGWYGGGAVMLVPAHDQRDYDFAKKYDLPVKTVISPDSPPEALAKGGHPNSPSRAYEGEGRLVNSGEFSNLPSGIAKKLIIKWLEEKGRGRQTVSYKLRDWVFSRQRYWGEPIPLIHCPKCGVVPVPEEELPIELPHIGKYEPTRTGESPLARVGEWVNVTCPKCGGAAQRETDTMPNWAGSCWYFLRFADPHNDQAVFDPAKVNSWLPVDWYLGGAEHAVLHLLYARFWVKAMFDLGLVNFEEPFLCLRGVGMVQGEDGRKMSKSYGNVVNPDDVVGAFGADTLRVYEMFMGPFGQAIKWNTKGVEGAHRFLKKVWNLVQSQDVAATHASPVATPTAVGANPLRRHLHRLIKKVGEDIENMKFNTAIAAMMEFLNDVVANFSSRLSAEEWGVFLRLLAPFAPYITEELWQCLSGDVVANFSSRSSIHLQPWPNFDSKLLEEEEVTIIVQVDGKVRGRLEVKKGIARAKLRKLAEQQPNVTKFLSERAVKKAYVVDDRLINFATEPNP